MQRVIETITRSREDRQRRGRQDLRVGSRIRGADQDRRDGGKRAVTMPRRQRVAGRALARRQSSSRSPPWLGTDQALRQRLLEGASGAEVMTALTEFVDGLIIGRYRNAMRQAGEGRRSRGPSTVAWWRWEAMASEGAGSLFRHRRHVPLSARRQARRHRLCSARCLHHLWDLGFQVGHSMRTIQDCIESGGEGPLRSAPP